MKKIITLLITVLALTCLFAVGASAEATSLGDVSGGFIISDNLEDGIYTAGGGTVTIEKTGTACSIILNNAVIDSGDTYSIQSQYDSLSR